ncbi:MAG: ribose 5-phosphate isomerase B [Candidatus Cloacimonadaceae bacterium]|jgi:ribose 5-phosphate isomerase B|nr:ribose 5-phosphate isomerase B [Candidatus Cloacimonadota bacterium]MDD4668123.1 ribose 5-phosphate isomerase B [Candidatus Cloacimonadota bacterium]MDY0337122.1 ribose 5-phosphate isomerase B [Candidatus Cloacimonadaceae bacterium]
MKLAIASDHAGYQLKEALKKAFPMHDFEDFGTNDESSMDYPDSGFPAARAVAEGNCELGILICGSGIGMSITANKVPGIRAALCTITDVARLSRMHNNANVLVLAGRFTAVAYAIEIVRAWLETPFEGGRHEQRLSKINQGERK